MSAKSLEKKKQQVSEILEKVQRAKSIVLVDYRGLNVKEDTELRRELRKEQVEYKVLKNSLVLRALNEAGYTGLEDALKEPTAVAFSYDDATSAARIISENSKKLNKLSIKAGIVEGQIMDAKGIASVASIPPYNVLIGQLLGMLTHPMRSLAVVLSEVAKKKEAQ